jgi:hypothetical protein
MGGDTFLGVQGVTSQKQGRRAKVSLRLGKLLEWSLVAGDAINKYRMGALSIGYKGLLLTGGPFGTDTFHFYAMPTKSDSTNHFIK